MINLDLRGILDQSQSNRDLLIDELNDLLEQGQLTDAQIVHTANELAHLLVSESDPAVMESVLNFFGSACSRVGVLDGPVQIVISLLDQLPSGCLVHAIPFIGASRSPGKVKLITQFLTSSNPSVRAIAEKTLTDLQ